MSIQSTPNGQQDHSDDAAPAKLEWQAPALTSFKPVSETESFTGLQPGDGINNAS